MSVVLARIDSRLIHGQVLEAWVPYTCADCIMVANDHIPEGSLQRLLMEAAVPKGIRVQIGTIREIAQSLARPEYATAKILLLFENSSDALTAHRQGAPFSQLNLGNMHASGGTIRFSCTIALSSEDIENLRLLEEEQGVRIVSQCIPADRERPWRKLIGAQSLDDLA